MVAAAAAAALSRLLWTGSVQVRTEASDTSASSPPPSLDTLVTVDYLPPLLLLHVHPFSVHLLSSLPSFSFSLHLFFAHNHPLILCAPIFLSLSLPPSFTIFFLTLQLLFSLLLHLITLSCTIFPLLLSSSSPPLVRVMAAHLPGVLVM